MKNASKVKKEKVIKDDLEPISDVEDDRLAYLDDDDEDIFEEEEELEEEKTDGTNKPKYLAPPIEVAPKLSWLREKRQFCDVIFKVTNEHGTRKFPCHRMVLAACSPLFEAMLYPNPLLPEPIMDDISGPLELQINDVDPDTFEAFLECIYTDDLNVTAGNISLLIELGKKYQIEKVQMICSEYMQYDINLKNALSLFDTAPVTLGDHEFGLSFIRGNIEELLAGDGIFTLSRPRLIFLLKDNELETDELFLFQALQRLAQKKIDDEAKEGRTISRKEALGDLIKVIRFPTMNDHLLTGLISPLNILTPEEMSLCYRYAAMTDEEMKKKMKMPFSTVERVGGCKWDDSKILKDGDKKKLLKIMGKKGGVKLTLLYRGSRDGFTSQAFHSNCNAKPPTMTFIQPANDTHISGGYFEGDWGGSGSYSNDPSYLFSLKNPSGNLLKYLPRDGNSNVYRHNTYGPTWGGGHDLYVSSNMTSTSSYTNPHTFTKIADGFTGAFTSTTLFGTYNYSVREIEVFSVTCKM